MFTRIALALFGEVPWRAVPYIPVEIMLLPRWFPFHLDKVSYWSRTVMVPLFVLCTYKPRAKQSAQCSCPRAVHDARRRKSITTSRCPAAAVVSAAWRAHSSCLDRCVPAHRSADPEGDAQGGHRAARSPGSLERLNGEDGLGAIFPAMVNALEAMVLLGYADDDPRA